MGEETIPTVRIILADIIIVLAYHYIDSILPLLKQTRKGHINATHARGTKSTVFKVPFNCQALLTDKMLIVSALSESGAWSEVQMGSMRVWHKLS